MKAASSGPSASSGKARSAFKRFLRVNRRITGWLEERLPHAQTGMPQMQQRYIDAVLDAMRDAPADLVIDVGGGARCVVARRAGEQSIDRFIATDVTHEGLRNNPDVRLKVVCDASVALPFSDESAGLIISSWAMEHLPDVQAFIAESKRVLRPGGRFICVNPNGFAPFALINRAMPNKLTKRILRMLHEEDEIGFPAYYDRCSYTGLRSTLVDAGLGVERMEVGYYQSYYYDFFVPVYLASVAYELIVRGLGARGLAAYFLVVARKPKHSLAR